MKKSWMKKMGLALAIVITLPVLAQAQSATFNNVAPATEKEARRFLGQLEGFLRREASDFPQKLARAVGPQEKYMVRLQYKQKLSRAAQPLIVEKAGDLASRHYDGNQFDYGQKTLREALVKETNHLIDEILRGTGSSSSAPLTADLDLPEGPAAPSLDEVRNGSVMKPGQVGNSVVGIQNALSSMGYDAPRTGIYDDKTKNLVKNFQSDFELSRDGLVGKNTLGALEDAKKRSFHRNAPAIDGVRNGGLLQRGHRGSTVEKLQNTLRALGHSAPSNGHYDRRTERAVKDFQKSNNIEENGLVGPTTFGAMETNLKDVAKNGITVSELRRIMPNLSAAKAAKYLPYINQAMAEFGINTKKRQAAFLAQIAHETGELRHMEEIASGRAYEWRRDLGNVYRGDGVRFKGRGAFQLTGRANYRSAGKALGLNLIKNPKRAADPDTAFRIAGWYWKKNGLARLADKGYFHSITKRINGGYNGKWDRYKYYKRALNVLPNRRGAANALRDLN